MGCSGIQEEVGKQGLSRARRNGDGFAVLDHLETTEQPDLKHFKIWMNHAQYIKLANADQRSQAEAISLPRR
jgi:hypothetical protein